VDNRGSGWGRRHIVNNVIAAVFVAIGRGGILEPQCAAAGRTRDEITTEKYPLNAGSGKPVKWIERAEVAMHVGRRSGRCESRCANTIVAARLVPSLCLLSSSPDSRQE
jgi:hypothetical protein